MCLAVARAEEAADDHVEDRRQAAVAHSLDARVPDWLIANARGCVGEGRADDTFGMMDSAPLGDDAAQRESAEMRAFNTQRIEQCQEIAAVLGDATGFRGR